MNIRRKLVSTVIAAALLAGGMAATGSQPMTGELSDPAASVSWSGRFGTPFATAGSPEQCRPGPEGTQPVSAVLCDRFLLNLNLPEGYWASHPGSLEVAIRWDEQDSTMRDLDLFIFDSDGNQVGQSAGQDSEAEVAFIHTPANGLYDIYVVPVSSPNDLSYEGLIDIEPDATVDPNNHGDLLPDLVSVATTKLMVATGEYYVDPVTNNVVSCYPEEMLDSAKSQSGESYPTRCLRFDQIVANLGAGRLELRFDPSDGVTVPYMYQRVYRADGTHHDDQVDEMEFHAIHGHWHYKGFGRGELYDASGNLVVQGKKRGFCLVDVQFPMWGQQGNEPRRNSFPGCQLPTDGNWVVEGIDRGWADNYNWFLADQFLDISNVADGKYRLDVIANPNGIDDDPSTPSLLESDYSNNRVSTWICLHGQDASILEGPSATC